MRYGSTEAERRLPSLLRNRRLAALEIRRQLAIDYYIKDFICFSAWRIVEANGSQLAPAPHDAARDACLRTQGFRILRIWSHDILARPNAVVDAARLTQQEQPS